MASRHAIVFVSCRENVNRAFRCSTIHTHVSREGWRATAFSGKSGVNSQNKKEGRIEISLATSYQRGPIGSLPTFPYVPVHTWSTRRATITNQIVVSVAIVRVKRMACTFVVNQHIHKNGGTSFRDWLLAHERAGNALYSGYDLGRASMKELLRNTTAVSRATTPTTRATNLVHFTESHISTDRFHHIAGAITDRIQRIPSLQCKTLVVTRWREPTQMYVSFYRWAFAFRRQRPDIVKWLAMNPNLQSMLALNPLYFTYAESGRNPHRAFKTPNIDEMRAHIRRFDIVGTTDMFDEFLIMVARRTGLNLLPYVKTSPRGRNKQRCRHVACRNIGAFVNCSIDDAIYKEVSSAFRRQIALEGDALQSRVRTFQYDTKLYNRQAHFPELGCSFKPTSEDEGFFVDSCPHPFARPFCRDVYAHRRFSCPWTHGRAHHPS